jgi:hypothetical protein
MRLLSESEFKQTCTEPMSRVEASEKPPFDFWPYVEAIPEEDLAGYTLRIDEVECVYRHPAGVLEHVLVKTSGRDVFIVVVLDRTKREVVGHHLLDLPKSYGVVN